MAERTGADPDGVAVQFHLAEFQALRSETVNHLTFAHALFGLQITTLGVTAGLIEHAVVVGPALTVVTVLIWLAYLDQIYAVFRIAYYVSTDLRVRVGRSTEEEVLRWEPWLRRVRKPWAAVEHGAARRPEDGGRTGPRVRDIESERILGVSYPRILFVFSAALGLVLHVTGLREVWSQAAPWGPVAVVLLTGGLLGAVGFALAKSRALRRFMDDVNVEIEHSTPTA